MTDIDHREQVTAVRELGLSERFLCVANPDNPVHFLAVAEFATRLDVAAVEAALVALVERHPLLSVSVTHQPDGRWLFERTAADQPARVRVVDDEEATWQREAVRELDRPFDSYVAPLVRVTLLRRDSYSALLLCFDHAIADGVSSVFLLNDVVAALNGRVLEPLALRQSVETLIDTKLSSVAPLDLSQSEPDPRMTAPLDASHGENATDNLATLAMTAEDTAALVQRCRVEHTTVHAAMLVAASRVRGADTNNGFIRTMSPINIRSLLDVGPDCGLFISMVITGLGCDDDTPFWQQARNLTEQLTVARSPAAVRAMTLALEQAIPTEASSADTIDQVLTEFPTEMCVTNLGLKDIDDTGPIRPTAMWGPVVRNFGTSQCVIGVVTYRGQLRMSAYSINLAPAFLERVTATLNEAATNR